MQTMEEKTKEAFDKSVSSLGGFSLYWFAVYGLCAVMLFTGHALGCVEAYGAGVSIYLMKAYLDRA